MLVFSVRALCAIVFLTFCSLVTSAQVALDSIRHEVVDSGVVYAYEQQDFEYDANGDIISYTAKYWEVEDDVVVPYYQILYAYTANRDVESVEELEWDADSLVWVKLSFEEYVYDGNKITSTYSEWDGSEYVPLSKFDEYSDPNGRDTLLLSWSWNTDSMRFIETTRSRYNRTAMGAETYFSREVYDHTSSVWSIEYQTISYLTGELVDSSVSYDGETSELSNSSKVYYTYVGNSNEASTTHQTWSNIDSSYNYTTRTDYTYNENNDFTLQVESNWSSSNMQFEDFSKTEVVYNSNGDDTYYADYLWIDSTSTWKLLGNASTNYDASNHPVDNIGKEFGEDTNDVLYSWKDEYVFRDDIKSDSVYYDYDEDYTAYYEEYEKAIDTYKYSELISGDWSITDIISYYYTTEPVDTMPTDTVPTDTVPIGVLESVNLTQVRVIPNPATNTVKFDLSEDFNAGALVIVDLQGRKVRNQLYVSGSSLNVSDLQRGTYFYTLKSRGKTYQGKFVKR